MTNNQANKRIDAGIKRGPRPTTPRRSLVPIQDLGSYTITPEVEANAESILQRMLTESTTGSIASDYGIARKALTRWLRAQFPERWRDIMLIRALARKEDSDDEMETADDALSLARARERLKSAQFDLERLDSSVWGAKQEVTHHNAPPSLSITVVATPQMASVAVQQAIPASHGETIDVQVIEK